MFKGLINHSSADFCDDSDLKVNEYISRFIPPFYEKGRRGGGGGGAEGGRAHFLCPEWHNLSGMKCS